jgi:hypothetical protein
MQPLERTGQICLVCGEVDTVVKSHRVGWEVLQTKATVLSIKEGENIPG